MPDGDAGSQKLHPRLRTFGNGDRDVNTRRSVGSVTVASAAPVAPKDLEVAAVFDQVAQQSISNLQAAVRPVRALPERPAGYRRPKLPDLRRADDAFTNVFIEFYPERAGVSAEVHDAHVTGVTRTLEKEVLDTGKGSVDGGRFRRRNIVCETVPISRLEELRADPAVAFVHPADPLKLDVPVPSPAAGAPPSRAIGSAEVDGRGEGVIIGIIDVGGFDFAHPEFLDADGGTRFLAIWDQGGDFRRSPEGFDYGSELLKPQLDAALREAARPGGLPAVLVERQSQLEPSSHGTHVASIAAGAHGVCPRARIAAVLIDVPSPDDPIERRRATFSDTSRITHAVEYLLRIAERENQPIAVNISLGTNGGAHDGSNGVSRWLDAYLATPSRAICVAAGNAGQEAAREEGDLGWIMGRIHTSGRIPAQGLEAVLEWTVVGNGIEDVSENELEIWYGAQDRFSVAVQPPGGGKWFEVPPRRYVQNERLPSGTHLSVYNELYHPTNGANYIAIYLSPDQGPDLRGIEAGVWKVRLTGVDVRDGRFDAWIERDDPGEVGREAGRRLFRFPSFFSRKSNIDSHSISSLACGHRVIAVANLDELRERINETSSQGPTRDSRCKPEIAAPGTDIVAANGFMGPGDPWVSMTGTSMACPYVTGVVGLMLAANRELTAAQCAGILQRTARPLAGASYAWINDAGWGRIEPEKALKEARDINQREPL